MATISLTVFLAFWSRIDILVSNGSARNVNRGDSDVLTACAAILDQRALHDTHQRFAVRSNCETFHALVCQPALSVSGNFGVFLRTQVRHPVIARQCERLDARARSAVKLGRCMARTRPK